jgi:hypothetical protein
LFIKLIAKRQEYDHTIRPNAIGENKVILKSVLDMIRDLEVAESLKMIMFYQLFNLVICMEDSIL